ncbi:hypothetical protein [Carboxylicivirga sp. RSCT41]|uniref:hypothetical protein n=1 Tax=Carboxylicivirga agarovorans TaxID=3417570 RepID=UPI003D339725
MEDRDKKYGIIGSAIFHIAVLLLLIFFGLSTLPQEEEGILVNFGDTVLGQGEIEPKQSQAKPVEQPNTPPPPKVENVPVPKAAEPEPEDEVKTQDFDEAPVVKSAEQKKKEQEEKDRLEKERQQREEQERIEREKEIERQKEQERQRQIEAEKEAQRQKELAEQRAREEAERKKKEEQDRQAAEARNRVSGAFSGKGSGESTSEGETGGSGNQGHVTGDPNSKNRTGSGLGDKGVSFGLGGRKALSLPKPSHNINESGTIVVEIKVNRDGKVVSAVAIMKGSSLFNNREARRAAEEAARLSKFDLKNEAAYEQAGWIRYYFEVN